VDCLAFIADSLDVGDTMDGMADTSEMQQDEVRFYPPLLPTTDHIDEVRFHPSLLPTTFHIDEVRFYLPLSSLHPSI